MPHLVKLNILLMVPFFSSYVGGFDGSMLNGVQTLVHWQEGQFEHQTPFEPVDLLSTREANPDSQTSTTPAEPYSVSWSTCKSLAALYPCLSLPLQLISTAGVFPSSSGLSSSLALRSFKDVLPTWACSVLDDFSSALGEDLSQPLLLRCLESLRIRPTGRF